MAQTAVYTVRVLVGGARRELAVEASNPDEAAAKVKARLGERGVVLGVHRAGRRGVALPLPFGGVGPRDLEVLCRSLLVMHQAGVTTLEAVETAAAQAAKGRLKKALELAAANIREGLPLKHAFRGSPDVFPEVFCQVMDAAEEAGAFEDGLAALAAHFEREARFKEKLRQAMAYPLVVAAFALLVALGMFTFVVPKFAKVLAEADIPLPAVTKAMLAFSAHARVAIPGALLGLLLLWRLARGALRAGPLRRRAEAALGRVPLVGALVRGAAVSRLCRTLALLLEVGVPAVQALEVAERVCPLLALRDEVRVARAVVRGGGSLSGALKKSRWLPPQVGKMAAVGEQSGRLPEMLERAAQLAEMEVDAAVQKLPMLAEGGMLVCVGGLVLFILLSIFLPILSMYQTVQK